MVIFDLSSSEIRNSSLLIVPPIHALPRFFDGDPLNKNISVSYSLKTFLADVAHKCLERADVLLRKPLFLGAKLLKRHIERLGLRFEAFSAITATSKELADKILILNVLCGVVLNDGWRSEVVPS